jgi:hypothetical protein
MKAGTRIYQSYILRIWQDQPGGDWRSSLTDTRTQECTAFPNLSELFAFLIQATEKHNVLPTSILQEPPNPTHL